MFLTLDYSVIFFGLILMRSVDGERMKEVYHMFLELILLKNSVKSLRLILSVELIKWLKMDMNSFLTET